MQIMMQSISKILTHFFPSSNLGFEDVNSLLPTISKTEMIQDQLKNLFQQTDTSSTSYEPSHILDTITSALKSFSFKCYFPSLTLFLILFLR